MTWVVCPLSLYFVHNVSIVMGNIVGLYAALVLTTDRLIYPVFQCTCEQRYLMQVPVINLY